MKPMYILAFSLSYNAPELGYWFRCETVKEAHELARLAGFKTMPKPTQTLPGDWIEEATGGGIVERGEMACKLFCFPIRENRHEENKRIIQEIISEE